MTVGDSCAEDLVSELLEVGVLIDAVGDRCAEDRVSELLDVDV